MAKAKAPPLRNQGCCISCGRPYRKINMKMETIVEDFELSKLSQDSGLKRKKSSMKMDKISLLGMADTRALLLIYFTLTYAPYCIVRDYYALSKVSIAFHRAIIGAQLGTMAIGFLSLLAILFIEKELFGCCKRIKLPSILPVIHGVSFVLSSMLLLAVEGIKVECDKDDSSWACAGCFSRSTILFIPLALAMSFPSLTPTCISLMLTACFVARIVSDIFIDSVPDIMSTVSITALCFTILREILFKRGHEQQDMTTLMEQASQQMDDFDTSVKHLVANVAHDLKTPVSSFMAGVDGISTLVSDLRSALPDNTDAINASVAAIEQYLRYMKNTNNFMLMTINRCIDYTKASKGLKLVPKYETIDLMDTLSLPLHCMKDIQNRITIRLQPCSKDICSHIITDKQWLQENVLCLLSNAVKYSSVGHVAISVHIDNTTTNDSAVRSSVAAAMPQPSTPPSRKVSRVSPSRPELDLDANRIPNYFDASTHDSSKGNQFLRFEIDDMGIGMGDEAMAALFSPFQQNQRLAGGSGLGLFSLAKRIEALHGKCGVERRKDGKQGSVFWFTIPYRPDFVTLQSITSNASLFELDDFAPISPKRSSHSSTSSSPSHKKRLHVLIVDDSSLIVRMTTMMLKKLGYHVSSAENGAEALRMIFEEAEHRLPTRERRLRFNSAADDDMADILCISNALSDDLPAGKYTSEPLSPTGPLYDVILMDLQMPIMDGLEATRRLREWESEGSFTLDEDSKPDHSSSRRSHHFVVGVSANCEEDTLKEAKAAGFDAFLSKPFNIDAFHDALDARHHPHS